MTGDEFGRALERAMTARVNNGWDPSTQVGMAYKLLLLDLRAALASKDAGPLCVADEVRVRGVGLIEDITPDELARLRAWEKWGREVAKLPLSALPPPPQDAGEMK